MKFKKEELEIIAYCMALLESDCTNEITRKKMHNMLAKMQAIGIWGNADFYDEEEE